jgi:hypothetical protein
MLSNHAEHAPNVKGCVKSFLFFCLSIATSGAIKLNIYNLIKFKYCVANLTKSHFYLFWTRSRSNPSWHLAQLNECASSLWLFPNTHKRQHFYKRLITAKWLAFDINCDIKTKDSDIYQYWGHIIALIYQVFMYLLPHF